MAAQSQSSDEWVRPSRVELVELVRAASLAPSPDNNQPLLFEEQADGELLLLFDKTRRLPSDVNDMFSMIALGAALENLCIAAREQGWEPHVRYLLDSESREPDQEAIAGIRFTEGAKSDPLYPSIEQRITCRKLYCRCPVAEESLRVLEENIAGQPGLRLHWVSDRPRIRKLAWLVAAADRIRFEYEPFHAELYRQLRFKPEEAEETLDGLDVRCLELPPGGVAVLHWLRVWPRMRRLNRLGLSKLMSLSSALQVWKSGTIGMLTTEDTSQRGYLSAGCGLQRVWLAATKQQLAFHPLGSLPIFLSLLARSSNFNLSEHHRKMIAALAHRFKCVFVSDAAQRGLVMLFRLGEAPMPGIRSLRRSPQTILLPL